MNYGKELIAFLPSNKLDLQEKYYWAIILFV